jgi:membrane-associated phospholipid phosphatase
MRSLPLACCLLACTLTSTLASAQEAEPQPLATPNVASTVLAGQAGSSRSFWAPFTAVPRDFVRFASLDTLKVIGLGVAGAASVHRWDDSGMSHAREHMPERAFRIGNVGGNFLVQTGGALGVYAVAHVAGHDRISAFGADLLRAQILTQGIVQVGKASTRRTRPDGSNDNSLPSGHAATTFATASVVQRHFGWAAGVPAYAFGAYVGAARMSANRHHLSDVIMGAAVGIAAGRTVTVHLGKSRFAMGVAPTVGGAAVTFTK